MWLSAKGVISSKGQFIRRRARRSVNDGPNAIVSLGVAG